jgi:hypothetical protein
MRKKSIVEHIARLVLKVRDLAVLKPKVIRSFTVRIGSDFWSLIRRRTPQNVEFAAIGP